MAMKVVRLTNESDLLADLRANTILLINSCQRFEPIKKLVECHEILDLTLGINKKFPRIGPHVPPECDEGALLQLRTLTLELSSFYSSWLPKPDFSPNYVGKVKQLLWLYKVPKHQFR